MALIINPTCRNAGLAVSLMIFVAGCQGSKEPAPAMPLLRPTQSHQPSKEKIVVIPPTVATAWKAVRISVVDKSRAMENSYALPIGSTTRIPSTTLSIRVDAFLPTFVMEGTVITSSSDELKNPGVKVDISDNGVSIYKGWLFARFPNTHAFTHPRYGFTLIGVDPVGKK